MLWKEIGQGNWCRLVLMLGVLCSGCEGFINSDGGNDMLLLSSNQDDGLQNLALYRPVASSNGLAGNPASLAVDGSASTYWNSGGPAPAWIRIYLAQGSSVEKIRLLVAQLPDGYTDHALRFYDSDENLVSSGNLRGHTYNSQWLEYNAPSTVHNVWSVEVYTNHSPSWVAWIELQVLGTESSSGSGQIWAQPATVEVSEGGVGTSTIHWDGNGQKGWVFVNYPGNPGQVFASGWQGSQDASWILGGVTYTFTLRTANDLNAPALGAVDVTGVAMDNSVEDLLGSSFYLSLPQDLTVSGSRVVLERTFQIPSRTDALLVSDGRFYPRGTGLAEVFIQLDGVRVSNRSRIDWRGSSVPIQHSYNCIGSAQLAAGTHTVRLIAQGSGESFSMGARSNLSVMFSPATDVDTAVLVSDTGPFEFTTGDGSGPLPMTGILSRNVNHTGQVFAMASGSSYHDGHSGDAMWGIALNGTCPSTADSTWTVNDIWSGAELEGPMYSHARFQLTGQNSISLMATEFPWGGEWGEDTVVYSIRSSTSLVVLHGGFEIAGAAPLLDSSCDYTAHKCIGTDQGWPGCPPVNSRVLIAEDSFEVPEGHPGVVLFQAKSRIQGDVADQGGITFLILNLDGQDVGSVGVQQLTHPNSISQRTLTASYLAAAEGALSTGDHTIRMYMVAQGSFIHVCALKDLPLIYFD